MGSGWIPKSSNSLQSDEHVCIENPHKMEYNLSFSEWFLMCIVIDLCKVGFG